MIGIKDSAEMSVLRTPVPQELVNHINVIGRGKTSTVISNANSINQAPLALNTFYPTQSKFTSQGSAINDKQAS